MIIIRLILFIFIINILTKAHAQGETDWSHRIISREKHPLSYWLSLCGETVNELTIDGKHFEHVRGAKPFYLQVLKTNLIVFVEDETNYSVIYHVFNMDTDEDIAIRDEGSWFGRAIGSSNQRDKADLAEDGRLLLSTYDGDVRNINTNSAFDAMQTFCFLDLKRKTVSGRKTLYFNAGKVISEAHSP